MMQSLGFWKLIVTGIPLEVPDSNVQITFNLTESYIE